MFSLLFMFVADPGLQQVHVEGRAQATHIDLRFHGRPTFQAFQSQAEGLLVVDVVGGKRPAGFPEAIRLHQGAQLKLVEHVGSRTRLLRLELHSKKGTPSSARALGGGIRLELAEGSKGLRVFQASGSRLLSAQDAKAPELKPKGKSSKELKRLKVAVKQEQEESERLRQLIGNFRRHSGTRTAELRGLDEKLSDRRSQAKQRQDEVKEAGQALSVVEQKIRLRRQEIVKLEAAEADAKRRLDQVRGSSRDRSAELNRLELVELAHRAEITRLVREEMELEKGDTAYLARMAKLQLSVKALAKKQEKLAAKASKREATLKAREQEAEGLKAEQSRYRRRIASINQRHSKLSKGVATQDKRLVQLRSKLDRLDGELAAALGRFEKASKGLTDARTQEADYENRAVALRARIAKLVRDTADREVQHGQANRQLGQKRAQIKALTESVTAARREAQKAGVLLAKARKAVATTEQRAKALQQELARLKTLAQGAREGLGKIESDLAEERESVVSLKERLTKRRAGLSRVVAGEKSARAAMSKLSKEKKRIQSALRAAQQRLDRGKRDAARMQREVTRKKEEVRRLESSVGSLKRQAKTQKRRVDSGTKRKNSGADDESIGGFGGNKTSVSAKQRARRSKVEPKSGLRVKRVGYRPVGPERVVIHLDGRPDAKLKRISDTTTVVELRGARSVKSNASLNTKRFGGRIHRISSRFKQGRVRIRIKHEAGLRLDPVSQKGRLEVRVR